MSGKIERVELLADDFSAYPVCERLDHLGRDDALGPWIQTTLHYSWRSERIQGYRDCALPWRIAERGGHRFLEQPESFFNAMLRAGEPAWCDYVLELDLAVADGPAGPVVRYHTSRRNYWVAFETGEPVRLIRRDQNDHVLLGASSGLVVGSEQSSRRRGLTVERDRIYRCRVECAGSRITVSVDGREVIEAEDGAYPRGQIAIRTEGPSRFASVRVTVAPEEADRIASEKARSAEHLQAARDRLPQAKPIHEVSIPLDADYLHIQDVNDDGRPEILAIEAQVMKLDYIRLARLSVFDWEGRLLWRLGEPRESKYRVHGDVAFNIADIDADGRTEILITRDFEILVLDGATGKLKRRSPTPRALKGREDFYEHTVGDSLLVCNLRGLEAPRDFILKDRYRNLWAYTDELEPLWHVSLNTGHYPRARDINGDGRDEVMAGYTMLDAEGYPMWTVPGSEPRRNVFPGPEHCDSMLIERFGPDGRDLRSSGRRGPDEEGPLRIAMAASDMGFLLLDPDGSILAQHRVGHAQSLGVGRFRPDLPGRQFAVATAWGNTGILNLFDCDGNPLLIRELYRTDAAAGKPVPVHWRGDGSALMLAARGLVDGNFDLVVPLPAGRPVRPFAYDVNDDGVDEVFRFHDGTLSVYGPESVPEMPTRRQKRSLTNWSLYGGFFA